MRLVQGRFPCRRYSYDAFPYICSISDFGTYSLGVPASRSCSTADCRERTSCAPPPLQGMYSHLPSDLPYIQQGAALSLGWSLPLAANQCLSLFGGSLKVPGGSPGLFLLNHACKLFIRVSIFQSSQLSSVRTISGLTCGSLLRVDITNPRRILASPNVSNAS